MVSKYKVNHPAGFCSLFFKAEKMPEDFCDHITPVESVTKINQMSPAEFPVQIPVNNPVCLQLIQVLVVLPVNICYNSNAVNPFETLAIVRFLAEYLYQFLVIR